jgi:hypothetical protein
MLTRQTVQLSSTWYWQPFLGATWCQVRETSLSTPLDADAICCPHRDSQNNDFYRTISCEMLVRFRLRRRGSK